MHAFDRGSINSIFFLTGNEADTCGSKCGKLLLVIVPLVKNEIEAGQQRKMFVNKLVEDCGCIESNKAVHYRRCLYDRILFNSSFLLAVCLIWVGHGVNFFIIKLSHGAFSDAKIGPGCATIYLGYICYETAIAGSYSGTWFKPPSGLF